MDCNSLTRGSNNRNKKVVFKNCAPFIGCKIERNKEIDHARDVDVVIPVYNLIECSGNYSKTSESL